MDKKCKCLIICRDTVFGIETHFVDELKNDIEYSLCLLKSKKDEEILKFNFCPYCGNMFDYKKIVRNLENG